MSASPLAESYTRGTIELKTPKSLTDLRAALRNLDLKDFTPYAAKFAGYRIESGRLSADLRYRVRDGRLVGDNHLAFARLDLGEKVQSASALDAPIELAVALLSDAQGRINVRIPVRGDLNDPQFDLGGLFAKAIGNFIGKIVAAPFRILASILGGHPEELNEVRFGAGSTALAPPQEENLALVAKALAERPKLELAIRGSYDPEEDLAALRRRAARLEIAKKAGYDEGAERPGSLDFGNPKIVQAAERLFLQRAGTRLELAKLREDEQRYGRLLLERLATATPLEPEAAETLGRTRGESVLAALVANGVDAARLGLAGPEETEAEKEGVPTTLTLSAGSD